MTEDEMTDFPATVKCASRGCDAKVYRASKNSARFCRDCRDRYGREMSRINRRLRELRPREDTDRPLRRDYARRLADGFAMAEGWMPDRGEDEL